MQEYWNNFKKKAFKPLLQLDALKNIGIDPKGINIKAYTEVGKKIAHHHYHKLWIDSKEYEEYFWNIYKSLFDILSTNSTEYFFIKNSFILGAM